MAKGCDILFYHFSYCVYSADPQTARLYYMIDENDFVLSASVFAWRSKCSRRIPKSLSISFSLSFVFIILSLKCVNTLILLRLEFVCFIFIDVGDMYTRVRRTRCRSSTEMERRH